MKVQLFSVDPLGHNILESLGLERLKAHLKKNGIDVKTTYLNLKIHYTEEEFNNVAEKIDETCDIFGFSIYHSNRKEIKRLVQIIKNKKSSSIVCLGSKYATLCYELLLKQMPLVDFVMLGDGEYQFVDAINFLTAGGNVADIADCNESIATRKNMTDRKVCSLDINTLPWPDRTNLKKSYALFAYICDMHGCNGNCSFCGLRHSKVRLSCRSAQDLMDEVISIYNETGIRVFYFTSGSFEIPGEKGKERIRQLCGLLQKYPIKFSFRCYLRAENFKETDRELLQLMKKSGFNYVFIGIEAGNEADLRVFNKLARIEDNYKAIQLMNEAGIYVSDFGFIMFNPYSTREGLKSNYHFLVDHKNCYMSKYISDLKVILNTAIYHRVCEDGLLIVDDQYRFQDENVAEMFRFIKEFFYEKSDLLSSELYFNELCELYYMVIELMDCKDITIEFNAITEVLFSLLKEFFSHLYEDYDLDYCKENFTEFNDKMSEVYKRCDRLLQKVRKKYMHLTGERLQL